MSVNLNPLDYYRLPWNYADNAISWLEPTTVCNLRCEGCYRDFDSQQHKSLEEVRAELELFRKLRKSDCISIAGGDPLVYPHIVELVGIIRSMGWKPIINTNGIALDEPLLRKLKEAGVYGFTLHVDSTQRRPDTPATTETELNDLRLKFARMLSEAGNIACSFNATVSEKTLHEVPALVEWARQHADLVQTMVFILFRSPGLTGDFDNYARGEKIEMGEVYKESEWGGEKVLMAQDVVNTIREADPAYEPCAFLNGTANPASFKWLLANRTVFAGRTVGYMSPLIDGADPDRQPPVHRQVSLLCQSPRDFPWQGDCAAGLPVRPSQQEDTVHYPEAGRQQTCQRPAHGAHAVHNDHPAGQFRSGRTSGHV